MKPNAQFMLILLLCYACGASSPAAKSGVERIEFGNGGGFTGAVSSYALNEGGQVLKKENGEWVRIRTIDKKQLNSLFSNAADFKSYQYQVPDNTYSFIKIKSSGGENYVVWTFGADKIDGRLVDLHNKLMELVKLK